MNLVASPEGLQAMYEIYPKIRVVTAWVDEGLNEKKYIVPGLGGKWFFALLMRFRREKMR